MRPLVPLLSVWVLLLSGWSAAAQPSSDQGKWSGRASLTAGYGWSMPDEELALTDTLSRFRQTAEVVLRYERKKFFVSTRLSQMQDRNHTDGTKIVFSGTNDLDELTRFDMITRHSRPAQKRYEARTDIRWTPSERASFSGYVGYVDGHNTGENTVGQFKVVAEQLAFSLETVDVRQRMALSGFRGNLLLPDHKILLGGFDWTREWNWRHLQWDGIDTNLAELYRAYRLTPFFIRDRSNAFLTYRDSTLFGVPGRQLEGQPSDQGAFRFHRGAAGTLCPAGLESGKPVRLCGNGPPALWNASGQRHAAPGSVGTASGRGGSPGRTLASRYDAHGHLVGVLERPATYLPEHLLVPAAGTV